MSKNSQPVGLGQTAVLSRAEVRGQADPAGQPDLPGRRPASTRFVDYRPGDIIDRHHHSDHQLVYTGSGVLQVTTDAGRWIATTGRAVWLPAGHVHAHRFLGASRMHTVSFTQAPTGFTRERPTVVAVSALLRELVRAVTKPRRSPAALEHLRAVILDELADAPAPSIFLPVAIDDRLSAACQLVESDLSRVWAIGELAARVGAGERTLARLFRTEFGMTYPQWRTQVRLAHAAALLAEARSVTEVAFRCSWNSPSAFIDVYRRSLGSTPGEQRR